AFLLGDDYEQCLVDDLKSKTRLVREVFEIIAANATAETRMLLALRRKSGVPLYKLSVQTSEWLLALQSKLYERLPGLLARPGLLEAVLAAYVPPMLIERLGMNKVVSIFSEPSLTAYRDAIVTKKLASMALYRHAADWPGFLKRLEGGLVDVMAEIAAGK
ncbi:MAG TPA: NADP-specific glutamate dehydrogenase GdhA, partial [Candidatus Brocadiia bacterium]|nr:NADP-specific glutamate dehydrogenase GdhA [Candidatus Brocadiia bacterium]